MSTIEIRCPEHASRLLLKIGRPKVEDGVNLIESACRDCRADLRKQGHKVSLVLHLYNVVGDLIETRVVPEKDS